MSKRIVICCDGTGNEINTTMSNVLKFFRILEKNEQQKVFYSPGVGTLSLSNAWQRMRQKWRTLFGLATGYGMDDDILAAYQFLCLEWQPGDKIYLTGFSRGAYTVRVLAALIDTIGVLAPEQYNLASYGLTTYKKASGDLPPAGRATALENIWSFGRVAGGRQARIEFIGVWDSVASVIVPRMDRLFPSMQTLPFTRTNRAVKIFRQAISIDERRRMFRLNRWNSPQNYRPDPYDKACELSQDIRQIWFAGVHADVGGGYPESESGLSKYPLNWMLQQAQQAGLTYDAVALQAISHGGRLPHSEEIFVAPDDVGELHDSLTGGWWLLECLPKALRFREWRGRTAFLGWYLPLGEPRFIADGALIHTSVQQRMAAIPAYQPVNLPAHPVWVDE